MFSLKYIAEVTVIVEHTALFCGRTEKTNIFRSDMEVVGFNLNNIEVYY